MADQAKCSVEILRRDIASAMQDPHDLNTIGKCFVKQYVVADRKAPNAPPQLGPLAARPWILSKCLKGITDAIEQAVCSGDVV
ncbi:hypothetical protein AOQ73_12245 [Bradyrhizobium pachyrhizi]|nr:hypothetical protein AOQ73_12245 [Bradyrhizobium pachyrhizi]